MNGTQIEYSKDMFAFYRDATVGDEIVRILRLNLKHEHLGACSLVRMIPAKRACEMNGKYEH
ncbi:MAG: hypothetical protein M0P13_06060, partial [Fibrobacteraceae bacterium]|nr:hypothetical protein [Fibrobacteraceae bacterium]